MSDVEDIPQVNIWKLPIKYNLFLLLNNHLLKYNNTIPTIFYIKLQYLQSIKNNWNNRYILCTF